MQQRGFTLIEMVLTMIVSSILVLAMAGFMKLSMDGSVSSYHRRQLQSQAQFAIEKMTREIRHAVPYSLKIENLANKKCIDFRPIYSGVFWMKDHLKNQDGVSFFLTKKLSNLTKSEQTLPDNLSVIINPINYSYLTDTDHMIEVGGSTPIKYDAHNNPLYFVATDIHINSSLSERAYAYFNDSVTYCLIGKELQRSGVTIANDLNFNLSSFDVTNNDPKTTMINLLRIALVFEKDGETSTYKQDVRVINVP